jgi:phosphoribosylglycinamide formyltransferase-1
MTLRIAALASGAGSNVAALAASIEEKRLDARLALVLSNNPEAPVLEKAGARGIAVWTRNHREFASREAFDREMLAAVKASGADTIVLAGYMRLLSPSFVRAFPGRILNVHPSLLPAFPGPDAVEDALAHGARFAGATVHFVDEVVDNGPIIIQGILPVSSRDDRAGLMPRIHALEHRIYPQALQWLAEGRLKVEGRIVRLLPGKSPGAAPVSSGNGPAGPWMVQPPLEIQGNAEQSGCSTDLGSEAPGLSKPDAALFLVRRPRLDGLREKGG